MILEPHGHGPGCDKGGHVSQTQGTTDGGYAHEGENLNDHCHCKQNSLSGLWAFHRSTCDSRVSCNPGHQHAYWRWSCRWSQAAPAPGIPPPIARLLALLIISLMVGFLASVVLNATAERWLSSSGDKKPERRGCNACSCTLGAHRSRTLICVHACVCM